MPQFGKIFRLLKSLDTDKRQMMPFKGIIPVVLLGSTLPFHSFATIDRVPLHPSVPSLVTPPTIVALTADEVKTVANEIAVRIEGPKGGSGVLLEKKGNTYYILTNWHVIDRPGDYQVVTPDGKRHSIYYSLVRRVPGVDLAVVPFNSSATYRIAQVANSDRATAGNKVYVAGWPRSGGSLQQPIFISTEGLLSGRQKPWNGYTLVYTNLVRSGMSGGPVLDDRGQLVAINGIVKLEDNSDKVVGAGIEINTFLKWRSGVTLPVPPQESATQKPTGNSAPPPPRAASNVAPFAIATALKGPSEVVSSVAISPSLFASGNSNGTISVWTLPSGELKTTLKGHRDAVNTIALSADGQSLVSGSDDRTIRLWNLQTGSALQVLQGHSDAVSTVAISPDGQWVVSGSWDKTVKVWNGKTGTLLHTLTGHAALVNAVAIAPDGKTFASGSKDGSIKLWNLQTGKPLQTLKGNNLAVLSVAFSPDGKILANGNGDGSIGVWNLGTGQLIRLFSGHTDGVWSVTISPDSNTLITGSWDKTVKLWDLRSGNLQGTLSGHAGYVTSVAISKDGQTIVSGGWQGQIKVWRRKG